jgi:hypothetical protein
MIYNQSIEIVMDQEEEDTFNFNLNNSDETHQTKSHEI